MASFNDFISKVKTYREKQKKLPVKVSRSSVILAFIVVLLFFLNKRTFLFAALTLGSGIFSYYHSRKNRTPMDLKLTLFLALFITRYYGILYTLLFFVVSDTIPSLFAGESLQGPDLFFYAWFFVVNLGVYIFPEVPLTILGPILVLVEAVGSFFINSFFGIPGVMSLLISGLTVLVRIVYFLTLGEVMRPLFMAVAG